MTNDSDTTIQSIDGPRYFRYWEQPELEAVVTEANFEIVSVGTSASRTADWLFVIAKKPA